MLNLYPSIKPYNTHNLQVDEIHNLYIEECGIPDGIPAVFIHGGPGSGCVVDHRRFFDPEKYRIILFDQRGCGRSKPHAELKNNETKDLIEDLEKIRKHLDIKQWLLFGGSWGATLAILYAEKYPKFVTGMILRGTFLGRKKDIDWFVKKGASQFYPDEWENFIRPITKKNKDNKLNNILLSYYELLTGVDDVARMYAAKTWSTWESVCATLEPNQHVRRRFIQPSNAFTSALFECHYFLNNLFLKEDHILKNCKKLSHIPSIIIHGRYDMVCPLENAYLLHKAWEGSELQIIRNAGHSGMEPGIVDAVIHATNYIAK